MPNKKPEVIDNREKQLKALRSIDNKLNKQVNLKHQFKGGIYRGIGFAIGASIIGGIIVAALISLFDNIDNPFVQDVVNEARSINSPNVDE